uniref:Pleckstrin homology like domain family A member 2 n=1 Tax=Anolis carolinensis TaxID=28377 RepID=A0A803TVJ7_ANOCA
MFCSRRHQHHQPEVSDPLDFHLSSSSHRVAQEARASLGRRVGGLAWGARAVACSASSSSFCRRLWKSRRARLFWKSMRARVMEAFQQLSPGQRTGKYVYFTIVTTDRREIDFRCPGESCWNASITLALIDFQNKRALRDFHSRRQKEEEEEEEQATARAPHAKPPTRRPRLARAS